MNHRPILVCVRIMTPRTTFKEKQRERKSEREREREKTVLLSTDRLNSKIALSMHMVSVPMESLGKLTNLQGPKLSNFLQR